ncbi:hypothetical protein D3C76_1817760 [compost metagenome]
MGHEATIGDIVMKSHAWQVHEKHHIACKQYKSNDGRDFYGGEYVLDSTKDFNV